ncbi:hypothetical protein FRC00_005626 [Tulasnella sp. 408]|nr:hypothetical protein FRC00_005626 [Tulasnella sp. 408]
MSKCSSAIEIVATAAKLLADIGEIPVLSPLKPIGGIVLTICEHAAAVKVNKEAAITLADQANNVIRVLANRTRDLDGAMPGGYFGDIESLQNVLLKIATTLQSLRQRNCLVRLFAPKADALQIEGLSSELNNAMQIFGEIDTVALRVHDELHATDHYSIQSGTYNNQAVVVKKYYKSKERDIDGIESIRRLWQEYRVGPPAPLTDSQAQDAERTSSGHASAPLQSHGPSSMEMPSAPSEVLKVKESEDVLRQLTSVVRFLDKMDIEVAWWQFKVSLTRSHVICQQGKQIVLIDWTEKIGPDGDVGFQPQYAVHILGLGFSDVAPDAFHEAGRFLHGSITLGSVAGIPQTYSEKKTTKMKEVWDALKQHPRFEECDMDELYSELSSKVKCDGGMPGLDESDRPCEELSKLIYAVKAKKAEEVKAAQQQQRVIQSISTGGWPESAMTRIPPTASTNSAAPLSMLPNFNMFGNSPYNSYSPFTMPPQAASSTTSQFTMPQSATTTDSGFDLRRPR